jgi:hypothetical protein
MHAPKPSTSCDASWQLVERVRPCCSLWLVAQLPLRGRVCDGRHAFWRWLLDLMTQDQAQYSLDKSQRNPTSMRSRRGSSSSSRVAAVDAALGRLGRRPIATDTQISVAMERQPAPAREQHAVARQKKQQWFVAAYVPFWLVTVPN